MSRTALQNQSFRGHQGIVPTTMKQPAGRGAAEDGRKPSRLMQMREDYQRRMLKEKEERMVNMYEDNQRKNMERVERMVRGMDNGNSAYPNSRLRQPGHMQPPPPQGQRHQLNSNPSVRDFFRERREIESKGGFIPPIDQHYKQSKSRTGSGNSYHKNSAGVDRAQPLAPIKARHSGISSAPNQQNSFNNSKSRLVKHNASSPDTDENDNYKPNHHGGLQKKPSPPARGAARGAGRTPAVKPKEDKMSDFQKWQVEQNKVREDRLKKLNMRAPPSGRESGDWGGGYEYEEEEEEEGGYAHNEEVERQQRELMEKIARQQAELDRLRREREEEEEMERKEAEMLRKQRAADEERRRRQQQEEARQRREAEAQAKREEEEQRKAARARQERQRYESHVDRYEDANGLDDVSQPNTQRSNNRRGGGSHQTTPRFNPRPPATENSTPRGRPAQPRRQPPARRRSPSPDHEEMEVPGPGIDFYEQAALEEGQGGRVRLVPCKMCGRKFAEDRVQKHQAACDNAQKKRKVFDPTKMRTEGTDMAKYVSKGAHKKEPPKKKKADWRRQHEEFVQNIRYAKKMQQMEEQGVSLKDLPPPPPSHNPDLVPCPHCGRTFNDLAAERHIPRCNQLKTRPVAGNKRR